MKKILLIVLLLSVIDEAYPQWINLHDTDDPYVTIVAYDSMVMSGSSYWGTFDLTVSTDAGTTWSGSDPFPDAQGTMYLTTADSMVYACLTSGMFRALKNDLNWSDYGQGLSDEPMLKICIHDSIQVAVSYSINNSGKIFKRIEGDGAWTLVSDASPVGNIFDLDYDGTVLVLAGSGGIAESYDLGSTWTSWNGYGFEMTAVILNGDTIIAASKGGIYRKLISSGNIAEVSNGLMKLWNPYGYDYYGEFELFHHIGNHIFVCGETGVYKLLHDTWYWEHTGLDYWTDALEDNGTTLFAAQGYLGIWAIPLDQLIVGTGEMSVKEPLVKMFPNPASDQVFITSGEEIILVSVYDPQGRLVLEKEPVPMAQGQYVLVCTNIIPGGMYIVRIAFKESVSVSKILIRR